jgi:MFS family permease
LRWFPAVPYPTLLRALASHNYRLFFSGQALSLLGNWMSLTASAWLVYELSRDPFLVGLLAFASQIPVLLLAPLGGMLGDHFPRQRLMWWLNLGAAGLAATLALLTLTDQITLGTLFTIVVLRGLLNAAEFPTRQAFIVDLVDRRADLPNAIALNSSLFNGARLIGPSIAGIVIATSGPGLCYLLDAVSFTAILTSILAMRLRSRRAPARREHPWLALRTGFAYARDTASIRPSLLMVPMIALAGFAASTLAPVFARDVFHGDAKLLGLMFSAVGAGALVSAVLLALRPTPRGLPRWIAAGGFAIALGQAGVALSPSAAFALLGLVATGFGTVFCMAGNNTLIQSHVDDDKRGRVMGLFAMGQGMFPIGGLLAGALAAHFGPRPAVLVFAVASAGAAWLFLRHHRAAQSRPPRPLQRPAPLPSDSTA